MPTTTGSITLSLSTVPALTTGTVTMSAVQTAAGGYYAIQSFPISVWTAVYLGTLTNAGVKYIFFKNNSSTNYVEVAIDSGGTKIITKIPPLKFAFTPTPSNVTGYWIRSNTSACPVLIWAVNE